MSDFIVSDKDESLINLKDPSGKHLGCVEAVDVIDCWVRSKNIENPDDWFMYFQSDFKKLTGVHLTKTLAVMLYKHACDIVEQLKKSGYGELEPTEPSDTAPSSPSET